MTNGYPFKSINEIILHDCITKLYFFAPFLISLFVKNFLFYLYFPLITLVICTIHKCQKIYSPRFLLKLPILFPWFFKASLCFLWRLMRSRTFSFKLRPTDDRFLFVENFLATVPIRLSYLLQEETKWLLIAILWINRKYI